jgi:hypothetical protein
MTTKMTKTTRRMTMSDLEAVADNDDASNEAPPAQQPPRGKGRIATLTRAARQETESEGRSLSDWMRGLGVGGAAGSFQVKVTRLEPMTHGGKKVGGFLKTYSNEFIDEAILQDQHGGGKFQVQVLKPDERGSYVYFKAKNIDVAGDPKALPSTEDDRTRQATPDAGNVLAAQAMNAMQGLLTETRREAARGAPDGEAIARSVASATGPIMETVRMLQDELKAARAEAVAARQVQADPVRDAILSKVMEDDSSRTASIRMAHQSELAQLRQSAADTEARLRDQFARDLDRLERGHERQIDTMKHSYESQIASLKHTYEGQISTLTGSHAREISSMTLLGTVQSKSGEQDAKRLERDNTELRAEVARLREKKDKSIFEQVKEIEELKEVFGDGDEKEKSTWEKALETLGSAPAVIKMLGGLTGADQPAPAQQPQLQEAQPPPPFTPFQAPDGNWYTHDGQGTIRPYDPNRARRVKQRAAAAAQAAPAAGAPAAAAGPEGAPPVEVPVGPTAEEVAAQQQAVLVAQAAANLPRDQVQMAVTYLENAFRGGQEAPTVAQSLRSQGLVPGDIFQFIREQGVDPLLDKVARLESSSPLATQKGRNWVRNVAKSLVEG